MSNNLLEVKWQLCSVFINEIEFEYVKYDDIYDKENEYFNIDCSFQSGSKKHEQWDQLYEDTWKTAWSSKELHLKLAVPHLNISGLFSITQFGTVKYEDKYIISIRVKKPNLEEK